MDEVEYHTTEKTPVIFYLSHTGIKDRTLKLELCYQNNAIALITIAFDTDFDIALILDLLLKVKELQLLKRVDFLKILDTMSTET